MVPCNELVGKVVRSFSLYEDGPDGPEIAIEFTDGTVFSSSLNTSIALEAKITQDEGGQPQVLKDYSVQLVGR